MHSVFFCLWCPATVSELLRFYISCTSIRTYPLPPQAQARGHYHWSLSRFVLHGKGRLPRGCHRDLARHPTTYHTHTGAATSKSRDSHCPFCAFLSLHEHGPLTQQEGKKTKTATSPSRELQLSTRTDRPRLEYRESPRTSRKKVVAQYRPSTKRLASRSSTPSFRLRSRLASSLDRRQALSTTNAGLFLCLARPGSESTCARSCSWEIRSLV